MYQQIIRKPMDNTKTPPKLRLHIWCGQTGFKGYRPSHSSQRQCNKTSTTRYGYALEIVIQEVLWSIRGSCWEIWSNPLTNVKWHSDPWPTVTSLPIRLSTNSMTFLPSLTFTELRVVSMEHLQRVWLASRERLPFRTTGSVPHFWTC